MARRDADAGGMSLDSLMDTLTNVVGILLIILIFTVLSGVDAVKRIKGFVDEISDRQYAEAAAHAAEVRKLLEEHRDVLAELENEAPQVELSLARHREMIQQLKSDLEKLASAKVNVDELKKEVEERRARVAKLEEEINAKEKEIASLRARLAEAPARGPDPEAKIVNLPDPREAPKGAQPIVLLCRRGRVAPVDAPGLQAKAAEVVKGASRVLFRQNRIDCQKMAEIFEKRFVGDRYCQLKVRVGSDAKPHLAVEIRPDAGDKTETIAKRTSQFHHWIRGLDSSRVYLDFRVFSDSFDTYLEARNAAARQGILAGWTPYPANGEYWIGFGVDFQTTCLGKEPVQAKPAPPPGPGEPVRPPPPPDVVD